MNKIKTIVICFIVFSCIFQTPRSELNFNVIESKVCNIYYEIPSDINQNEVEVVLKDLNGNLVSSKVASRNEDGIFFGNVWFGDYYIEIVGIDTEQNCFPVSLDKKSLDDAHIQKELTVEENFFTEEESKVISNMGYTGITVPDEVVEEVRKALGSNKTDSSDDSTNKNPSNIVNVTIPTNNSVDNNYKNNFDDNFKNYNTEIDDVGDSCEDVVSEVDDSVEEDEKNLHSDVSEELGCRIHKFLMLLLLLLILIYYSYKKIRKNFNKEVN